MPSPDDGSARKWHRELVEASPVPVAVYDAEGVLRYVNDAAVAFVDASDRAAVVGRPAGAFVHPEDREIIAGRVERVIEDREAVPPAEIRFVATTGEQRHAVVAGAPVTYEGAPAGQAVLNDITERTRREQQLRRERDRFELLFEHLPSAVVHGVAREGEPIVERVNRRFEEVFGYDRETVEGENLDDYIVPEEDRATARRLNERILSEGRVRAEVTRETADGPREFLLNIVMQDLEADAPEGYSIYTDITERKRTERELERQNERLEEFASVVAHDLRNPLTVARGSTEVARDAGDATEDHLDRALDALDRMERIIDDLLALARHGETVGDPEPVDLKSVANAAWDAVSTDVDSGADPDLEVEDEQWVLADRGRLRELLENLFRNAVEHSSTSPPSNAQGDAVEHGSTSPRSQAPEDAVEHGSTSPPSNARGEESVTVTVGHLDDARGFYVADDGPGIPPDEREQVFDSGYTTDEDGTGFGLAIVERIAEAHGWSVRVTESGAGGARFEVVGVDDPGDR